MNVPVINSNTQHFCSPNRYARCHVTRINPDKSTFLNSNLLVSNILNHLSPTPPSPPFAPDAYQNKDTHWQLDKQLEADKKERMGRVNHLAKCRSQTALEELREKQKKIESQVEQISLMRTEMGEKARDIMGRKEDTAYLGRNIFLQGDKFLKQMKDHHPAAKVIKIEATRMLMKETAKKKGALPIQNRPMDDNSEISSPDSPFLNQSCDASIDPTIVRTPSHSKLQDHRMAQIIKDHSFENVFQQQKRHAAWNGFRDNWALGFVQQQDVISTRKKRRTKRSPKQKYAGLTGGGALQYNDKLTRHLALKKYSETFAQTASSFQVIERA